jgi:hypothetical protein
MRRERRFATPDMRAPAPVSGREGVWCCWKEPGVKLINGRHYPKVKGDAERKFHCVDCDRKLEWNNNVMTPCPGPKFFEEWDVESIKQRFGGKSIMNEGGEKVETDTNESGGESKQGNAGGGSKSVASGEVDSD